ncbi:hypothetical protein GQ43DRAFT_397348 [Delitschia confertaspora ATCC 74209]|uniref:UBC core domain-containing protein n=1 Tax=Delitschia confertaspora ATCC 74209 TaxID=1513339 RepID=A0A9P4JII8_9PLEO|nr:hypothetical protein GQ43DRAFT_397348 [Delitschia confertaspora ATCC 74209]
MNSKSLRRLAADYSSLHTAGLPPNYLFPCSDSSDASSDLTSLDILLAGPVGTPYSTGVWKLHLDIPPTYPSAPPTANFRTKIWHPNVDENTGAVCVETLKRDWKPELTLRDVLVTISCLLIQPNPASALNEDAGKLANEDWKAYCGRAKIMTSIYADVPSDLAEQIREAQNRGEDKKEDASEPKDGAKNLSRGQTKGKARVTSSSDLKNKRVPSGASAEDEENTKLCGQTADVDSDPESDWIPGPVKTPVRRFGLGRGNLLGFKGLDDSMDLDDKVPKEDDPYTETAKLPNKHHLFAIPARHSPFKHSPLNVSKTSNTNAHPTTTTATSILPRFTTKRDHASLLDAYCTSHPLFTELSWSWQDSAILHGTNTVLGDTATESKDRVWKRMAGEDFEQRREWEFKKFRQAGGDLKRWNRGDFGARTGLRRL